MTKGNQTLKFDTGDLITACDILHSFFYAGLPNERRKDLKKLRHYVINDKQYCNRNGARHVYSNYEDTLQLIKAVKILLEQSDAASQSAIITEEAINTEKTH